ncbi:oligoribonuclease [Pseudactinotalea sp. HY158]|uniref:oligoribonuclease n=1 Tax=Pseudactinotalea sp. HY158 TaxID=2654547 RepID=UPI00129CBFAF|nr:oligoribonuclease [Pseudactinotalea sp. HY158]QGH71071.1 oligoribonuclease [Pseudactinotalea sp. HY158]
MQSPSSDPIVWIDCEMTGLDLTKDALIEIAVIVTDSELHPLGPGLDLVIAPPPGATDDMVPIVQEMHTASGLLDELASGTTLAHAQQQVLDFIKQWVPKAGTAPLAGNSVGTDKMFLDRDMPELTAFLHYRIIDVSSIKELARRWYQRAYFQSPKKAGGHRALADIAESIDELRYYRSVLFPADPGPDSATAKAAAAAILASPTPAVQVDESGALDGDATVIPDTPVAAESSGTGEAFGL